MTVKNDVTWRAIMIYIFIIIYIIMVLAKAFYVMTVDRERLIKMSSRNKPDVPMKIAPNRGDIWAEDGRILSTSVPYYQLRFDGLAVKKKVFQENIDSLAYCLSTFFRDRSKQYYKDKLTRARNGSHPNRYLLINRRRLNHIELKKVRNFPIFRLGKNSGGFRVLVYDERILPHGKNLAGRTIGYLNESADGVKAGSVGLENTFEKYLKGENGEGFKRMMSGTWMILTEKEPVDGYDVVTTINVDYQDIVQSALKRQLEKSQALNGSAILMEVATGDIKAIANMRKREGGYVEDQNFAIGSAGELGSVMKTAAMIALLEDDHVRPTDTIDLGESGRYKFYDRILRESHGGLGRITVSQVIEKSANGIAKLVEKYYKEDPEKLIKRWYAMGLNKKTGICLPGEGNPYIKYPNDKTWSGITLPWMSIGYELEMTPLQMLAFYNAIANDGQRMRPRLVKEICKRGDVVESFDTEEVGSRLCSNKTLEEVQDMLEGVVKNGTARNIYTPKYSIAGKTGTAKLASGASGYGGGGYRASFVGYFPADKPLYSCIVVIDKPRNGYYATIVAAPVFKEISDKVYSMAYVLQDGKTDYEVNKAVPVSKNGLKEDFETIFDELDMDLDGSGDVRDTDWVLTASGESENMVLKPRRINFSTVPNAKGMGLRDAIYVLENSGLRVGSVGSGMVQQQSVRAGSEVARGTYVHLVLR